MTFLAPVGLLALVAVAGVVVLYMRRATPPTTPVPTVRFWRPATQEPAGSRRLRRPPLTPLFLIHLLIAALLAVALARPALALPTRALAATPEHLVLLLDGSLSMAATDVVPDRWSAARDQAVRLLRGLSDRDAATVVVAGGRLETLDATTATDRAAVADRLARMPLPGGVADLDRALTLVAGLDLPGYRPRLVVISDGATAVDPTRLAATGMPAEWRPVGGDAGNVAITAFSVAPMPDDPERLNAFARVVNYGDAAAHPGLTLEAAGLAVDRRALDLDPGGATDLAWALPRGAAQATLSLAVDDALAADNRAEARLDRSSVAHVTLVSDQPGSALERALRALPTVQLTVVGAQAYDASAVADLVVFDSVAREVPAAAGVLYVHPPSGGPFPVSGTDAEPKLDRVRPDDPLLRGVDLTGVSFGEMPVYQLPGWMHEVAASQAGPLVASGVDPSGRRVGLLAFDPARGNLPSRVTFPILVANLVGQLGPRTVPAAFWPGDRIPLVPDGGTASLRVTAPDGSQTTLPVTAETRQSLGYAETSLPGEYRVEQLDAQGAVRARRTVVVNGGSPAESDVRPRAGFRDAFDQARQARAAAAAPGARAGLTESDLWPLLVAGALGLLLIEWLIVALRGRPRRARRRGVAT